jgi:triosephosphate isomerase
MIFLNLKTYKEATGEKAVELLSCLKNIKTKVKIIPIAQATDIYRIKKELGIDVWAQHVDPIDEGRATGYISAFSLKQAGASGVLINHSEHKLEKEAIIFVLKKAKENNLKTLLVGHTKEMVLEFDKLSIDFLAYEDERLIASETSILETQSSIIKNLAQKLNHPLIVGAGIKSGEDVRNALICGAKGVLIASHFVKAKSPEKIIEELISSFLPSTQPSST